MSLDTGRFHDKDSFLEALSICVDNIEVGLFVADYYTGEVILANRKVIPYANVTDVQDMLGKPCWDALNFSGVGRCSFCPYEKLTDDAGIPSEPHEWELHFEPLDRWLKVINRALIWIDGRLVHMVTFYDITETKQMNERLTALAFRDRLLGLKNEMCLEKDMQEAQTKPSLLLMDIIALQKVNEAYGREIGDRLLRCVRDWFIERDIPDSQLYRIGGDEFCLAAEKQESDFLIKLAGDITARFSQPWVFDYEGSELKIFTSAAIAIILSEYIQDSDPLLNQIERTLNAAKEQQAVVVYDKSMDSDYKGHLKLEMSLKRCMRDGMVGFDVFYQPILDTGNGTWCGLEALCRWDSPDLGSIPPLGFIPEAEKHGLIGILGLWVLETAVKNCKKWMLDKREKFVLNVNMSAVQFLDPTVAEKIIGILSENDYPGDKLCLEITESTEFTFCDQSLNTLERLKKHNVSVALDDFGTGYSSFNSLKNLPIDVLKIERVFVTDIETDGYHQDLFRSITEIAHSAGKSVVVEGVETTSQMNILIENGADFLQGYLFSKPVSAVAIGEQLRRFQSQT